MAHGSGILVTRMSPAIVTPSAPATCPGDNAPAPLTESPPRLRPPRWLAWLSPHHVALLAVLTASLLLRLWGIKQGLPYSYNSDEAFHFVPKAIGFFGHDLNPHYFLNPS